MRTEFSFEWVCIFSWSHFIEFKKRCVQSENVGNGKRNPRPRLIINGLNWSYSQTEQRNGNYLAGLLIAAQNWMKHTFGSDYRTTHAHTHTSRKEITNESMFDLEWISVPAEWPFICSFTTLYAVFRLSHCILFCYSLCVNASQTQTSKIYWHKQRLWLLSNIIKAEYRTVRIHTAWWMTFQYLHWMIVFTLRHPNDA